MSDAQVKACLDNLERLLDTLADAPEPGPVDAWHAAFREAVAGADRGPGWAGLVERAHALAHRLEAQADQLQAIRGAVREELLAREKGRRALQGYRPG